MPLTKRKFSLVPLSFLNVKKPTATLTNAGFKAPCLGVPPGLLLVIQCVSPNDFNFVRLQDPVDPLYLDYVLEISNQNLPRHSLTLYSESSASMII